MARLDNSRWTVVWGMMRVLTWATLALLDCLVMGSHAWAAEDYSNAETQLFMQAHLQKLKLPSQLNYQFSKTGSSEPGFEDSVSLAVTANKGLCCQTQVQFLSGARRLQLPEVEDAKGNPVILYFLERDIREMQRLTKGQSNYFRTRIRKAIYQAAQETPVQLRYQGHNVAGQEFDIAPYQDDPLRERFGALSDKHYVFTLSQEVPGTLVAIRTWVKKPGESNKLPQETLLLKGAQL